MRITQLSKEAVDALEKAFKKERNGRQKTRYQAIWLVAKGWKRRKASEAVGMSSDRIRQLITLYHKEGLLGLLLKPAPGNHRLLTNQQKQHIKDLMTNTTPDHVGLKGRFWNIPLLRVLVTKEFGLTYKDQDSYRRLFHWCGFSFHKPTKVNKRQKDGMIKRFEVALKKDSRDTREKMVWYW